MLEITIDNYHKCDSSISIKTHRHKNIENNEQQILHFNLIKHL